MDVSLKVASSPEEQLKAFMVRCVVFCGEQGVPYGIERDAFEDSAIHVLGEIDGEPVAAGRLRCLPDYAKLERIAVRAPYRGRGVGAEITRFLMRLARERGYSSYRMNAQAYLEEFYGRLGFRAVGGIFLEAGIEHVTMVRED
ncbi:MAG: GNAT family N-acetyltransferase [Proteobacteria bacterium]|nr:GNAT family N-acetyltransferase [Pseudomonadota bacterium]MYJ96060.1 GNAT family N-acetyltransferase [Pseudomonadota bacterium]